MKKIMRFFLSVLKGFTVVFCSMGLLVYTWFIFEIQKDPETRALWPIFLFMDGLMLLFLFLLLRKPKKKGNLNQDLAQQTNITVPQPFPSHTPLVIATPDTIPSTYDNPHTLSPSQVSFGLFQRIPKEVFNLLWFSNGPYKNYDNRSNSREFSIEGQVIRFKSTPDEPSAIDVNLVLSDSPMADPLGYYPSYQGLTPEQRTRYLSWLSDITSPIDIGYVFIFYYGLERHLLFGDAPAALAAIFTLRQFHQNNSFLFYSGDAILLYALLNKRADIIEVINGQRTSMNLRMLASSLCNHCLRVQDIVDAHKKFAFTNNRYIKGETVLFLSTLEELLIKEYGVPEFPILLEDFGCTTANFTVALANFSLLPEQRFIELPDIATCPRVQSTINSLLVNTHEAVKIKLRELRKETKTTERST